tara:strand:- start:309 stop:500 length:192 start_codon:yes stop_codon:yes gene_type:complete
MKIIYETTGGVVSVIVPSADVNDCIKDVPTGAKYKIVEDSEVPSDRSFRNAWEVSPDATWSTK